MSDLKLFRVSNGKAEELTGSSVALERQLQNTIESNMETLFGVRFLASEYSTGAKHRGRIDSLGIDDTGSPVIFEYKRSRDENVINQGLFYLDWLLDHQGEFKLLVMERLGTAPSRSTGPIRGWSASPETSPGTTSMRCDRTTTTSNSSGTATSVVNCWHLSC